MYIAARLAMQSPCERRDEERVTAVPPTPTASFHGRNIVVRELSENGFEADSIHDFPVGSLVRIRLPGAGAALARITDAEPGKLCASFVNPVGRARLAMTLGARTLAALPA
jgi:hypothetical protein